MGAGFSVVLLVAVVLPPFVSAEVRQAIMLVFSTVCHQMPERSPFIDGVQLAVCHRCVGIYAALAAAPIGFLMLQRWDPVINRSARWLILLALGVPGADWLGDMLGMWSNTALTRSATGAVFGLIVGYFLCRAFIELMSRKRDLKRARDPLPAGSEPASSR